MRSMGRLLFCAIKKDGKEEEEKKEGGRKSFGFLLGYVLSPWKSLCLLRENVNGLHLEGNSICLKERQLCCQMENVLV